MSTPDRWRERAARQHRESVRIVRNSHDPLYVEPIEEEVRFDAHFVFDAVLGAAVFFLAIVVMATR